jgi:hypothetical protein
MPTYTVKYIDNSVQSTTDHPLPLVDVIDSPPPLGDYSNYKHDGEIAMEVGTQSASAMFSISAPPPVALEDQTATIDLATTSGQETTVQWTTVSSTILVSAESDMQNTGIDLMRAGRPLIKLKGTVKMP